jgi:hypothetical protein
MNMLLRSLLILLALTFLSSAFAHPALTSTTHTTGEVEQHELIQRKNAQEALVVTDETKPLSTAQKILQRVDAWLMPGVAHPTALDHYMELLAVVLVALALIKFGLPGLLVYWD